MSGSALVCSLDRDDLVGYFRYLNELRQSGATNMFGAAPWLEDTYGLGRTEAKAVLMAWMDVFDREHAAEEMADAYRAKWATE